MMDIRHYRFQQLIPAMVVDVVEALADQLFDEVTVEHQSYLRSCQGPEAGGP
jgi:hypothetical protein